MLAIKLIKSVHQNVFCLSRGFHLYRILHLNQKWREENGLPANPNAYGVLTDSSDYSFLDGRATPYGTRQKRRIFKQKEIAQKVVKLSKEIDFAVDRHRMLQEEKASQEKLIIDKKLKPKGKLLLKSNFTI